MLFLLLRIDVRNKNVLLLLLISDTIQTVVLKLVFMVYYFQDFLDFLFGLRGRWVCAVIRIKTFLDFFIFTRPLRKMINESIYNCSQA